MDGLADDGWGDEGDHIDLVFRFSRGKPDG